MRVPLLSLTAAISLSLIGIAQGQSSNPAAGRPGVVTGGSSSVTVNGKPAARQGDTTTDGASGRPDLGLSEIAEARALSFSGSDPSRA